MAEYFIHTMAGDMCVCWCATDVMSDYHHWLRKLYDSKFKDVLSFKPGETSIELILDSYSAHRQKKIR